MAAGGASERSRLSVRRAEGRIVETLLAFSLKRFGKTFFERAWLDFWADQPPDGDFADIPEFDSIFIPWFVTIFVGSRAGIAEPDWPDEPLGLFWLRTERPVIDAVERAWLITACASPVSVFVVERVEAGRSLDIRDVLTGRHFHVLEQTASRTLRVTDLVFTRVVTTGDVCLMFGMAPYAVPANLHLRVLDWRDRAFGRRTPKRKDLIESAGAILDLYLELADELRQPVMPTLSNTDGDPFEPTTLVYELATSVAEVCERLRPLATIGADEHITDMETDEAGAMTSVIVSWVKAGNKKNKAWDNTILGTLRLTPGRLTADVNSAKRADRLAREVKRRLGSLAVLRARSVDNVDRMMKDLRAKQARVPHGGAGAPSAAERPAEFDTIEDTLYQQHLEAWIDTRVPALGNRTPRQIARTSRGRERLDALVAGFEGRQHDARPARRAALSALRRALGLPPAGLGQEET